MTSGSRRPTDQIGRLGSRRLASTAVRGTMWTLGGQWVGLVLTTASTVILGRLLAPDDFGLVGMVTAVSGFAQLLLGMGLSQATVQREDITQDQVSALFWLNVLVGFVLAGTVAVLAGPIAAFYGRPELVDITLVLSTTFLIGGMTVQHQALMNRRMELAALSMIELLAVAGGIGLAVVLAFAGAGYWALVAMSLGNTVIRMVLSWILGGWRPSRPRRVAEVSALVRFGAALSVFSVTNYISRNADNVLIGRAHGSAELGQYSRAYALLLLPIRQVSQPMARVAVPTLSALQFQPERFRRYYCAALGVMAFAVMPLVVVLALLADDVVLILLGPQWGEAARIFRVLAISGVIQAVGPTTGWLYTSTGNVGRQAVWGLISRTIVVLSFVAGLPWGGYGVAVSRTIVAYVLLVPSLANAAHGTPVRLADMWAATWRPMLGTAALIAAMAPVRAALDEYGLALRVTGSLLVGGAAYLAAVILVPGGRAQFRFYVTTIREQLRRRGRTTPAPATTAP